MLAVICLIISMFLGVAGQLFIKKGLNMLGNINFASGIISSYTKIFLSPFIIIGILIYFLGVFFWLYALSKVNLSFAYPFVSLSYILVVFSSWWLLGESISLLRWTGVMAICLGVFLISRS
jgi:drug/metabolite transporter (DMT)-like permease